MSLTFDTPVLIKTDGRTHAAPIVSLAFASDHRHLVLGLDGQWHRADFVRDRDEPVFELVLTRGASLFATVSHEWIVDPPHFRRLRTPELTGAVLMVSLPSPAAPGHPSPYPQPLIVTDVRATGRAQPVYCCVEPVTRSFTLGCGILSGASTEHPS
jgi:hypothetical protein